MESSSAQISVKSGALHIPIQETHLHPPGRHDPNVGKRVPRHVHCRPNRENESAPEHDHDTRREKPVPCASQRTIFFRRHPSSRLRGTNGWSIFLSREEVEAHISKNPTESQCFAANWFTESKIGQRSSRGNGAKREMTSDQLRDPS